MKHSDTVQAFFDAYTAHNVNQMLALCSPNATFRYVPMGENGTGSVQQAAGPWQLYIDAFPDFSTKPVSLIEAQDGIVICETLMRGTQGKDIGTIKNKGRTLSNPHLFIFEFDQDGLLQKITSFWDNDAIYAQLGHTEQHN